MHNFFHIFSAGLLAAALQSQDTVAAVSSFGTGCGTAPLELLPLPGVRPILNAAQIVDIINIPFGLAFMAYGSSNSFMNAQPLPIDLAAYGMPGCMLYHNLVDFALPMIPVSSGRARYTFQLPFSASFIGQHIYLQGWAIYPGVNPGGLLASNAIDMLLGDQ
ncbi:hypothetical protein LBMAG49_16540 [Planctomycetota bacterium]|nr:hypothetical protein [Planctomycetota bacterium]GDY02325.1 hypothetical protein LBMAG49_16540 [Planctomycetota bacterium]